MPGILHAVQGPLLGVHGSFLNLQESLLAETALETAVLAPLAFEPLAFVEAFVVGALTPLTAACALPLYPGFVSYLARSDEASEPAEGATSGDSDATAGGPESASHSPFLLGVAVVAGVVAFMGTIGLVFAYTLQVSLTAVVEVVSPVAFVVLFVLGIALALDLDAVDRLPALDPPETGNPYASAFAYGAFFGGIVLPCNPAFIALFFARSPVLFDSAFEGFVGFFAFGLGMGSPLLVLAAISEARSKTITRFLARHASIVNRVTGAIMVGVAAHYLVVVFDVLGVGTLLGV